jgi:hypothetical protein
MITRREGYIRSAGKEAPALAATEEFFKQAIGVDLIRIIDAETNYLHGDFSTAAGVTIECKGQPIDPGRFKQNFIEVCEYTETAKHADGFANLAILLNMSEDALSRVRIKLRGRGTPTPFGRPECLSVSITSIGGSAFTVYINVNGGHIYVYRSDELIDQIRTAVPHGMGRGVGRSNEDTLSVFTPNADWRWLRDSNRWIWNGTASESLAVQFIRSRLMP